MSGVARRAQVGKSALYLRWPDKQTLLGDAVLARTGWAEEVDQGSVRADLERLLFRLMRFWLEPSGWALLRIAVDGVRSGNRPTYQEAVTAAHRRAAFALVDRAVARGELRTGTPAQLLADVVYGTSMMKALTTEVDLRSATDAALLQTLSPFVDFLMSGLEPYVAPDPVGGPERLPASRSAGD
jgi:AcrR family transcriptional regulator